MSWLRESCFPKPGKDHIYSESMKNVYVFPALKEPASSRRENCFPALVKAVSWRRKNLFANAGEKSHSLNLKEECVGFPGAGESCVPAPGKLFPGAGGSYVPAPGKLFPGAGNRSHSFGAKENYNTEDPKQAIDKYACLKIHITSQISATADSKWLLFLFARTASARKHLSRGFAVDKCWFADIHAAMTGYMKAFMLG